MKTAQRQVCATPTAERFQWNGEKTLSFTASFHFTRMSSLRFTCEGLYCTHTRRPFRHTVERKTSATAECLGNLTTAPPATSSKSSVCFSYFYFLLSKTVTQTKTDLLCSGLRRSLSLCVSEQPLSCSSTRPCQKLYHPSNKQVQIKHSLSCHISSMVSGK